MVSNEFATGFDKAPNFFAHEDSSLEEAPSSIPKLAPPPQAAAPDRRQALMMRTEHRQRRQQQAPVTTASLTLSEHVQNAAFPTGRRSSLTMMRASSRRDLSGGGAEIKPQQTTRRSSLTMQRTSSQRDLGATSTHHSTGKTSPPVNRRAGLAMMKSKSVRDMDSTSGRQPSLGGRSEHGKTVMAPVKFTSSRNLLAGGATTDEKLFADEDDDDDDDSSSGASFGGEDEEEGEQDKPTRTSSSRNLFVNDDRERSKRPTLSRRSTPRVQDEAAEDSTSVEVELMNTFKSFRNVMNMPLNDDNDNNDVNDGGDDRKQEKMETGRRSRLDRSGSHRSLGGRRSGLGAPERTRSNDGFFAGRTSSSNSSRRSSMGNAPIRSRSNEGVEGLRRSRRSSCTGGGGAPERSRGHDGLDSRSFHQQPLGRRPSMGRGVGVGVERQRSQRSLVADTTTTTAAAASSRRSGLGSGRPGGFAVTPARSKSVRKLACRRVRSHGGGDANGDEYDEED